VLVDVVFASFGGSRDEEPHPLDDLDVNFGTWFDVEQ
jgi:hypothetical protein